MSQSLANILVHLVFSTKGRCPLLRDEEREELHAYLTGILKNHDSPLLEINSVRDHIHILFAQSSTTKLISLPTPSPVSHKNSFSQFSATPPTASDSSNSPVFPPTRSGFGGDSKNLARQSRHSNSPSASFHSLLRGSPNTVVPFPCPVAPLVLAR